MPLPAWIAPLATAQELNDQEDVATTTLTVIGDGDVLPIVLGEGYCGGKLLAFDKTGDTITVSWGWAIGECEAVVEIYIDGEPPVAGVTRTDYVGTTTQTADATLSAAIAGYTDTNVISMPNGDVGTCYSVLEYTLEDYPGGGMSSVVAHIQGQLTNGGVYSTNPMRALQFLINNDIIGPGWTADATSAGTVATDNDATVTTEARRTINLVLSKPMPAQQVFKLLATYASCWINRFGSTLFFVSDRPRSQDRALTGDDWLENTPQISTAGRAQMPTQVEVTWTDMTGNLPRERVAISREAGVTAGTTPRRVSRVRMPGINRYTQAFREAEERRLKLSQFLHINLELTNEHLDLELGNVIDVTRGTHLTNVDFRIIAPPRKTYNGARMTGMSVHGQAYSASVYSDAEPADPTYGASSQFVGDGIQNSGRTMHLLLELQRDDGVTVAAGEFSIVGVSASGLAVAPGAPWFLWNGAVVTLTHYSASLTGLTGSAGQRGYICVDTTLSDPFTVAATPVSIAFVWLDNTQWMYDDDTVTGVNFTPTSDYVAIGWLETGATGVIDGGGLFADPVTLTAAPSMTATVGATVGTNLFRDDGTTILDNIDLLNEEIVDASLGLLNQNPTFRFSRRRTSGPTGTPLVPANWFMYNTAGDNFGYLDDTLRGIVLLTEPTGVHIVTEAHRVEPGVTYEFLAMIRVQSGTADVDLLALELDADLLPTTKRAIGNTTTSPEDEIENRTREIVVLAAGAVTSTFAVVSGTYAPTVGSMWFSMGVNCGNESDDIEIEWAGFRNTATTGATVGTNLFNEEDGSTLGDIDIRNDLEAAASLGFLNANPTFELTKQRTSGPSGFPRLSPASWYFWGTGVDRFGYVDDTVRQAAQLDTGAGDISSEAYRLNPETTYEFVVLARLASAGSGSLVIEVMEYDSALGTGERAIGETTTSPEDGVVHRNRVTTVEAGQALTTSWLQVTGTYDPRLSAGNAQYFSMAMHIDGDDVDVEIEFAGFRDASTIGAVAGVNLLADDGATILSDINIRNDQLVTDALNASNFNPSMQIPADRAGVLGPAGYVENQDDTYPVYEDPAVQDVLESSTANTVNMAAFRVNTETTYEIVAAIKMDTTTNIDLRMEELDTNLMPVGKQYVGSIDRNNGMTTRTRLIILVDDQSVGTSYELISADYNPTSTTYWASPSLYQNGASNVMHVEWWVVREKTTPGRLPNKMPFGYADLETLVMGVDLSQDSINPLGDATFSIDTTDAAIGSQSILATFPTNERGGIDSILFIASHLKNNIVVELDRIYAFVCMVKFVDSEAMGIEVGVSLGRFNGVGLATPSDTITGTELGATVGVWTELVLLIDDTGNLNTLRNMNLILNYPASEPLPAGTPQVKFDEFALYDITDSPHLQALVDA